jgi:polyisoprenoid-binding protein YceI
MNHSIAICRTVFATAVCVASLAAHAEPKLVPAQSEVVFVSKQMGVPVEGRFKKFDGTFSFDPAKPAAAKIAFAVDTGSATLGVPETDAELPKAPWFNALKFPQATFTSSAVKSMGPGRLEVTGKLAIKGSAVDVVVPVNLTQAGASTTASGTLVIKRLAFKIGENEWADTSVVADDVQVKFKFTLTGVGKL